MQGLKLTHAGKRGHINKLLLPDNVLIQIIVLITLVPNIYLHRHWLWNVFGWDDGVALERQQAINWSNDDSVHWAANIFECKAIDWFKQSGLP